MAFKNTFLGFTMLLKHSKAFAPYKVKTWLKSATYEISGRNFGQWATVSAALPGNVSDRWASFAPPPPPSAPPPPPPYRQSQERTPHQWKVVWRTSTMVKSKSKLRRQLAKLRYTVKKVYRFFPSPAGYSRLGRVCLVTSWLGTGK
jgi:hypothetical protein